MFEIPQATAGRLWIMPRPTDLARDVARYNAAGVTHVVSMLASDEAAHLGLTEEGPACEAAGMTFLSSPIADFGLPAPSDFTLLVRQIDTLLQAGATVAVHCRAGIGRSGMVCCGSLVLQGQTAAQAIEQVSAARGVSVPDTMQQATFIATFAHNL